MSISLIANHCNNVTMISLFH